MKVRLTIGWTVLLSLVAAIGYAQQPAPAGRALSLAEAVSLAERYSPAYRQIINDRGAAGLRSTSSLLNMLLPTADISASYRKQAAGDPILLPGLPPQPSPSQSSNSWSLGFNYRLAGSTFANRGLASAQLRATEEDIAGARVTLETTVRTQYLNSMTRQAQLELARRSVERVTEQLNLARARHSVGQGTLIDVRRAEVDKATADVNLLQAEQNYQNQVLVLFETIGTPAPEEGVQLTDSFPVTAPAWTADSLVRFALTQNPGLRSLRARQESARWNVRSTQSQFLPSLNLSADYGKWSQSAAGTTNSGTNPWTFSIFASLPIFDGLSRNAQVSDARQQEDDLRQQARARELQVRTQVTSAYNSLLTAYQTIALQNASRAAANEALSLATQRYRVGSGTYLELLDARLAADRADADYVAAVYQYHISIAALENAVGRPLR